MAALLPNGPAPVIDAEWVNKSNSIARLHDRDDVDIWKGWKRYVFKFVPVLTILNTVMYLLYLGYRIYCVVAAQKLRNTTYAQAWVFIGVEIAVALPSLMHNIWTMMAMKKRLRPKLRLTSNDDVPSVDVFVTCCGEEDDLVADTVRAACNLDYPRDRFRVVVLDDGKSEGLENAVLGMSQTYPNLVYIARPKIPGKPHHFKAGNLNYGLDAVHQLPGGAGQFMAALDADMVCFTVLFDDLTLRVLTIDRFLSVTGFVLFCLIFLSMTRWLSPVLLSCSTTLRTRIPSLSHSTSSSTSSSLSRMLSVLRGALVPATLFVVRLSTRSATSLLDPSLRMSPLRH